jgi:divalent metal cation (Fe/Co/Zn/Cd) transporter
MKLSGGFDARRLRTRGHSPWRSRLGLIVMLVLNIAGALLALVGAAALLGKPLVDTPDDAAAALIVAGLFMLALGAMLWRRGRRRRSPDGLALSPHLMKRRD